MPRDDHAFAEDVAPPKADKPQTVRELLSLRHWLTRTLPLPDFLLGDVISTTSRVEIIGPTGLGKTNFGLAFATAISEGRDFLHWRGSGRPQRVLYVDGEMSRRLMQTRLRDAARRQNDEPKTLFVLSREDFPSMQPLNVEDGQQLIDRVIKEVGGADLAIFDNVQALLGGDMKDEVPWQETLPWIRDLTRRNIGQVWFHHTGHDETHGYGSKTREWQLDTVALMETVERPDADIAFALKFTKARERTPDNRADFEPAVITLSNDEWASERGGLRSGKKRTAKDPALELLIDALARGEGVLPPASEHIPPATRCINETLWRKNFIAGSISESSQESAERAFRRIAKDLLLAGHIGKWDGWVWPVRT
jgi:hypothetical protein